MRGMKAPFRGVRGRGGDLLLSRNDLQGKPYRCHIRDTPIQFLDASDRLQVLWGKPHRRLFLFHTLSIAP